MRGSSSPLPEGVAGVLVPESSIGERVRELGRRITVDHAGRDLVLVTVLRGGVFFLADLCRAIDLPLRLEFMAVSTYVGAPGGHVRVTKDLDGPIEGASVVVVEDIVDTGLTLNFILGMLAARGPASLEVCALLDKDVRRIADVRIEYRGFRIPDSFVVGYGLDLAGTLRNLPYVASLDEGVLEATLAARAGNR